MAGTKRAHRRVLTGVVVSDKMDKTVVVEVTRLVKHRLYKKYIKRKARFMAHDERNDYQEGDKVQIIESRPLSRGKRWRVQALIERQQKL